MNPSSNGLVKVLTPQAAASVAVHGQRISGLDGLRAISVLIVFISHYAPVVFPQFPILVNIFPGMFGVAIFFVISGLLISTLLLEEYRNTTDISLRNFYIRRLLRLSPALLIYVLVFFFAYTLADGKVDELAFVTAATYTSNYYQSTVGGELYYMPVWSLAIEEHFYLIFPATLLLLLRRKAANQVIWYFLALAVFVSIWRCFLASTDLASFEQIYHNTDTRLDAPLFGVVLALMMWIHPEASYSRFIKSTIGFGVGIAFILISVIIRDEYFRMTLRYSLQGFGILMVIGFIVFGGSSLARILRNILDNNILRFVGKLSYSIYLWHLTTLMFVKHLYPGITPMIGAAIGVAALGCAYLSYYWIERPFLGLRHKFGSHSTV